MKNKCRNTLCNYSPSYFLMAITDYKKRRQQLSHLLHTIIKRVHVLSRNSAVYWRLSTVTF